MKLRPDAGDERAGDSGQGSRAGGRDEKPESSQEDDSGAEEAARSGKRKHTSRRGEGDERKKARRAAPEKDAAAEGGGARRGPSSGRDKAEVDEPDPGEWKVEPPPSFSVQGLPCLFHPSASRDLLCDATARRARVQRWRAREARAGGAWTRPRDSSTRDGATQRGVRDLPCPALLHAIPGGPLVS